MQAKVARSAREPNNDFGQRVLLKTDDPRMAQDGPRWPRIAPRWVQKDPKIASEVVQDGPGHRMAEDGSSVGQKIH